MCRLISPQNPFAPEESAFPPCRCMLRRPHPLRVAIPQRFFDSLYCPHRAGGRHLYTAQSCGVRRHLYPRPYPRLKFGFALHCAGKSFQALEVPLRSAIAPRSGSACRFAYSVQVIYRVLPAPGFHRWERPSFRRLPDSNGPLPIYWPYIPHTLTAYISPKASALPNYRVAYR